MAKKSTPEPLTAKVIIDQIGRTTGFTLPVNPGFAPPNEVDEVRGVEPSAAEVGQAQRAIVAAVLAEYFPVDVRAWIAKQQRRLGERGLIDELVRMRPIPPRTKPMPAKARQKGKTPEDLFRANLTRAIQRSGPAKKSDRKESHGGIREADYGMRIALLALREHLVTLAVIGWWVVSEDRFFHTIRTDRRQPAQLTEVYGVLGRGGAGFVTHIEDIAESLRTPLALDMVNGLKVEATSRD